MDKGGDEMSKTSDAINKYSKEEDKPILLWLLHKYRWSSQFPFVASVHFKKETPDSWPHHVYKPTKEGRILYNYFKEHPEEDV